MKKKSLILLLIIFSITTTSSAQAFWGKKTTRAKAVPSQEKLQDLEEEFKVETPKQTEATRDSAITESSKELPSPPVPKAPHPLESIFKLVDSKTGSTLKETIRLLENRNPEAKISFHALDQLLLDSVRKGFLVKSDSRLIKTLQNAQGPFIDEALASFISDVLGRMDALIKNSIREIHMNEDKPLMEDPVEWQKFRVSEIKRLQGGRQEFIDLLNEALIQFNSSLTQG